jgi:predicted lipoprotein with Yx(FWY)xxD motif
MNGYGRLAVVAGLAAAGVVLAACGTNPTPTDTGGASAANAAIGTSSVAGVGTVLVDSAGKTLYFSDQDANGTMRCTGDCLGFWIPATASGTSVPRGSIAGLSVLKRADNGQPQFAYQGKPLYEFKMDSMAGQINGNGAHDDFNGTSFTWHAAVASGTAVVPGATSGNSGGGSGY